MIVYSKLETQIFILCGQMLQVKPQLKINNTNKARGQRNVDSSKYHRIFNEILDDNQILTLILKTFILISQIKITFEPQKILKFAY